jgi:hypothetical protein
VIEDLKLSVQFKLLDGKAPAEDTELTDSVRDVVGKLAAEAG